MKEWNTVYIILPSIRDVDGSTSDFNNWSRCRHAGKPLNYLRLTTVSHPHSEEQILKEVIYLTPILSNSAASSMIGLLRCSRWKKNYPFDRLN